MQRVWKKIEVLEKKRIPVTHEVFGKLIKDEWKAVKEEATRVCPIVSYEEIKKILGELKTETEERTATESRVEIGEVKEVQETQEGS